MLDEEQTRLRNTALYDFFKAAVDPGSSGAFTRQYWDFSPASVESAAMQGSQRLLCAETVSALRERRPGSSYLVRAAILGFLDELCDPARFTIQNVSSTLEHKEFIVSKLELLIRASHGRISKAELEADLSYNGDYLNRLLKQYRGKNLSEYSRDVMLAEAKRLLKETDLSVEEIMTRLSVTSRGHFFSLFRQDTGMTPQKYRHAVYTDSNR